MVTAIRANEDRDEYEGLDGEALAQRLTDDLPAMSGGGIARVEVLPGNIGLIEMHGFVPPTPQAQEAIAEAMAAVRSTDALIFDMRENGRAEEMEGVLAATVEAASEEPGVEIYSYHRGEANTFWFFALMIDEEAMQSHGKGEAMQTAMSRFGALVDSPPQMMVATPVARRRLRPVRPQPAAASMHPPGRIP